MTNKMNHFIKKPIYLDYNATTPVHAQVAEAILPYLNEFSGNPSSNHAYGFRLRRAVDEAREKLAGLIGAKQEEIVFTSCGSEANNLALKGVAFASERDKSHIITSAVEHPAVVNSLRFLERRGWHITTLPVDVYGSVSPDAVAEAIRDETILVSIIHGQNEIGTVQPLHEIAEIAHSRGVLVHTDAAQTVGKIPVRIDDLGVDLMSIAGNKFYGPKGVGALFIRRGVKLEPLIHGGGQENGLRAGTENAAYIAGVGKAAEIAAERIHIYQQHVRTLRDRLHQNITEQIPEAMLNGHPQLRLPNTLNLSFPGTDSTELLAHIRDRVACSTGSGCHAGRSAASSILLAIGRDERLATAALRLSLGVETTEDEVDTAAEVITDGVHALRSGAMHDHQA